MRTRCNELFSINKFDHLCKVALPLLQIDFLQYIVCYLILKTPIRQKLFNMYYR